MKGFRTVTPESVGVSTRDILAFLQELEAGGLTTDAVMMIRGNDLFFENYWAPFEKQHVHRLYSVSKSFVSLAVGFAAQDGLLSLDDPMEKFFEAELALQQDEEMKKQTVRNMLMMSTVKTAQDWFSARSDDRVAFYFSNDTAPRPAGCNFEYDSTGTFVLGALVERLTGKTLMDYLREKLFDAIGVSDTIRSLRSPGGHSWSDSAFLCNAEDLARVARFTLNGGSWDGKQLLDADYVKTATTKQIETNVQGLGEWDAQGYGYYFWIGFDDSFYFNGLGCQFAVCFPHEDLIFVTFGNNQGKEHAKHIIFDGFKRHILDRIQEGPLPQDPEARVLLYDYVKDSKIPYEKGSASSPVIEKVNGSVYALRKNPMGITRLSLCFEKPDEAYLYYTNAQGEKALAVGLGKNVFEYFPQEGYSDEVGSVSSPGHRYICAVSGGFPDPQQFRIKVQFIDDYLGTLDMFLGFTEDGKKVCLQSTKACEDFADEYVGWGYGEKI
ncbi:MAG: serine hydrolase [Lachnospiraceae bacterium]|nr:serine hydrolase [Lachnospiraceae bacterium]